MKPERARERYRLKIELAKPHDSYPRLIRRDEIPRFLASLFIPFVRGGLVVLGEAGDFYGPLRVEERVVTVLDTSSQKQLLRFLAPADEDTQALVAELHHDYLRMDADDWREKWVDELKKAFGEQQKMS